jgi:hypothetical protein
MGTRALITAVAALAFQFVSPSVVAQDNDERLYVALECMKSTSPDYVGVETGIWQAMHQQLVDDGKRNSWALYWVMYGDRSKCDYYTVTTFLGQAQLDHNPDYAAVFERAHPGKDIERAMTRTMNAREHVASELWVLVDSTAFEPHRFAIINFMQADDPDAYLRMESRAFKAAHQALLDDGHRAGWGVYELLSPTGSSIPYNYATVDLVNNLAPVPMAEAMIAANPDKNLEDMHALLELRDDIRSETWALVAITEPAPGN